MAIIVSQNGKNAKKIDKSTIEREGYLQKYIYDNPECIPLYDIKEDIRLLILAREFPTHSGSIDAIGIDREGEIYIIETKLYKNRDKRTVVAQVLDYGAALWKHTTDYDAFFSLLNENVQKSFNLRLDQKIQEYFGLFNEDVNQILDTIKENLSHGILHFVILMDSLEDRLKDLIMYVNQNSEFDIYAVELELYKHESYEIIIPRIFGAETKKDLTSTKKVKKVWNWELFKERLQELGDAEVQAAEIILNWAKQNDIEIAWSSSQRGAFILCFYTPGKKGFYPFSVTGNATISWNTPHQGNNSPTPFDKPEKRVELLNMLQRIQDATVDMSNVDGYNGFKMPLRAMIKKDTQDKFFTVCKWIRDELSAS